MIAKACPECKSIHVSTIYYPDRILHRCLDCDHRWTIPTKPTDADFMKAYGSRSIQVED